MSTPQSAIKSVDPVLTPAQLSPRGGIDKVAVDLPLVCVSIEMRVPRIIVRGGRRWKLGQKPSARRAYICIHVVSAIGREHDR